jgi:hypothetical protein
VIELRDPKLLVEASKILSGVTMDKVHVSGKIVVGLAPYNPQWKFYLDPNTISFFTFVHPACWSFTLKDINDHLDRVGTPTFLPTQYWCPRGYRLGTEQ